MIAIDLKETGQPSRRPRLELAMPTHTRDDSLLYSSGLLLNMSSNVDEVQKRSNHVRSSLKRLLTRAVPDSERLRYVAALPQLRTWWSHYGATPQFADRYALYQYIASNYLVKGSIDYLEFGVYSGASMKKWLEIVPDPGSRFYGFDTFSGLPEAWTTATGSVPKGTFDVGGRTPDLGDGRTEFVAGVFQESLAPFLKDFSPQKQLVIHCDADLYSATLFVLSRCNDILVPGSIVLFDEFSTIEHEFRALADYCSAYCRTFTPIGVTMSPTNFVDQVAIRLH